jgi:hypothetical protein
MKPYNDNRPKSEASRLLPLLGLVRSDGTVTVRLADLLAVVTPLRPGPIFPNDAREA